MSTSKKPRTHATARRPWTTKTVRSVPRVTSATRPATIAAQVMRTSAVRAYSHSIVAGGLLEMSYATRLMPRTSLMIRFEMRFRRS